MRQFMDQLRRSGESLSSIAPQVGIGLCTISDWGRRTDPRLQDFDRTVQAVGARLVVRRREESSDA